MEFQALSQIPTYISAIGNNSLKGHFKWPVEAKIVTSEYIRSISPYTGFLDKDKTFIFFKSFIYTPHTFYYIQEVSTVFTPTGCFAGDDIRSW